MYFYSYTKRNSQNYSLPKCRTQLYKTSIVLSLIEEWNALPQKIKDLSLIRTITSCQLNKQQSRSAASVFFFWLIDWIAFYAVAAIFQPCYGGFSFGDRILNILHTKLRHNCILHCDLHLLDALS